MPILDKLLLGFFRSRVERYDRTSPIRAYMWLAVGLITELLFGALAVIVCAVLISYSDEIYIYCHDTNILGSGSGITLILTDKDIVANSSSQNISYKLGYGFFQPWMDIEIDTKIYPDVNVFVDYSKQNDIIYRGEPYDEQYIYLNYDGLITVNHTIFIQVYCTEKKILCGNESISHYLS